MVKGEPQKGKKNLGHGEGEKKNLGHGEGRATKRPGQVFGVRITSTPDAHVATR